MSSSPAFVFDDDNDGMDEIYVDFGSTYGLWLYDGLYRDWYQMSALSPDSSI